MNDTKQSIVTNNGNAKAADSGAVIVTYNPDAAFFYRLGSIADQVLMTVVVDNGSTSEFLQHLHDYTKAHPRIEIISFGINRGIATALNAGLQRLSQLGFLWGYTFDHDSLPMTDFFRAMQHAVGEHGNVAIYAPEYVDETTRESITPTVGNNAEEGVDILSTMTSGNLVNLEIWRAAGRFDERFFIDYVDHEFCLRLKARGYRIVQVGAAVLAHNLGERSQHGPSFFRISSTNHSALRRYYITRNRLWVYAKYLGVFPRWVLNDIRSFVKETVKVVFFEEHKLRKIRAIVMGVCDAFRGNWPRYKE